MLEEIGFLDNDFFLYGEDVDLSFRAQIAGWKCVYVPTAIVYHKLNTTARKLSDVHVYYHTRNLEFVWVKNMPTKLMLRYLHHKIFSGQERCPKIAAAHATKETRDTEAASGIK